MNRIPESGVAGRDLVQIAPPDPTNFYQVYMQAIAIIDLLPRR